MPQQPVAELAVSYRQGLVLGNFFFGAYLTYREWGRGDASE